MVWGPAQRYLDMWTVMWTFEIIHAKSKKAFLQGPVYIFKSSRSKPSTYQFSHYPKD